MKTKSNSLWLAAIACGLSLITTSSSLQARQGDDDNHQEIERLVALLPTASAPTNAMGSAELEVGHRDSTNKIEIHVFGLAAGSFTVTVYDRSGGNNAVLGTISGGTHTLQRSQGADDHGRNRGHGGDDDGPGDDHGNGDDDGEAKFPLPAGIDPFDLGRIVISTEGGVEILVGDFSNVSSTVSGRVNVRVPAVAGTAEDDAAGLAEIRGHMRRGRGTGTFSLIGSNLTPRTTVHVLINGEDAGTARTDRHGRVRIRRNHKSFDVFSVSTVSVVDDSGGEVLKAQF